MALNFAKISCLREQHFAKTMFKFKKNAIFCSIFLLKWIKPGTREEYTCGSYKIFAIAY